MADEEQLKRLKQGVKAWNEWRKSNPTIQIDLSDIDFSAINLSSVNLSKAYLVGTEFKGINLEKSDFSEANLSWASLSRANLREANCSGANLSWTSLSCADFSGANLNKVNLFSATLIMTNLSRAKLREADLRGADLRGVDLGDSNLSYSAISEANFSKANLTRANLKRTEALDVDFTGARLTGVCIEDWHINSGTKLDEVDCEYVYRKDLYQERRPSDPSQNFVPGEFAKLFQEARNTFDLILHNGINWRAFAFAFNETNTEVIDEYGDRLFLRGYELLGDGMVKLKISYPEGTNSQKYQNLLEENYELLKENKGLLKENARLQVEDYEKMLSLPSQIIVQIGENNSVNDTFNNDFQGANIANFANKLEGNARQQAIINNFSPEQKQNLVEAAAEIQQLLNQLAQTNPTSESEIVEAVHQEIKRNPTLKAKLLGALKAGGLETLKAIFNHPMFSIPAETVKGWLEAEG